jgi:CHAD domain-containing protein
VTDPFGGDVSLRVLAATVCCPHVLRSGLRERGGVTLPGAVGEPPSGGDAPAVQFRHEITLQESLGEALVRVADTELTVALAALESPDLADGVHTARKAIKRTRAVLRMIRDRIPAATFREQNVMLRDAGRHLSAGRSAYVTARLAERLAAETGPGPGTAALLARLESRWETIAGELRSGPVLPAVSAAVADAQSRISDWDAGRIPDDFSAIAPGIRRVYRRGRSAMSAARRSLTTSSLHRWRTRVRYGRYQVECLHLMEPAVLDDLAADLAALAESLGEEHDLAELAAVLTPDGVGAADAARDTLLAAASAVRAERRTAAWQTGARIYDEAPAAFVGRLGRYWDSWRREAPVRR